MTAPERPARVEVVDVGQVVADVMQALAAAGYDLEGDDPDDGRLDVHRDDGRLA